MCGICGYIGTFDHPKEQERSLRQMMTALVHRGPDSEGIYATERAGLGFRRLSFVDLAGGNQPLQNEDGSLLMVCNGEIYDYRSLTEELKHRGHVFRTRTDVEVLLHLYEEQGVECLAGINGQFALALYDSRRHELVLARDHAGIAPLFYTVVDGTVFFSSEIKSLLSQRRVPRKVNLTALDQVLCFPGLVSASTMFEGIHSLAAGHYLRISPLGIEEGEFWDLSYPLQSEVEYKASETEYLDELLWHLTAATQIRMEAEVPVGFYLSGGLDSSLIGALVRKNCPSATVHSFGIAFKDEEYSEARYQRAMAAKLSSVHHSIEFGLQDISRRLPSVVRHCECPIKESYNTASIVLSECARQHGVSAVLTGEGADELFAGYLGYKFDQMRRATGGNGTAPDEVALRRQLWGDEELIYEHDLTSFREVRHQLYSEPVADRISEFDCTQGTLIDRSKVIGRHPLHQRSYLDFKLRMQDHLLGDHGDRMALANSVEARYPFLDLNVIRHAVAMPPHLKLKGLIEKYALRRAAEGLVPPRIISREKHAFVAPGSPALLRTGEEWINSLLEPERIRKEGYFNPATVENLRATYVSPDFAFHPSFQTDLLMIVISFGIFLDLFNMPSLN